MVPVIMVSGQCAGLHCMESLQKSRSSSLAERTALILEQVSRGVDLIFLVASQSPFFACCLPLKIQSNGFWTQSQEILILNSREGPHSTTLNLKKKKLQESLGHSQSQRLLQMLDCSRILNLLQCNHEAKTIFVWCRIDSGSNILALNKKFSNGP